MYTLYYSPGTASMVVHLALLEIGAPYELKLVDFDQDEQHGDTYLKLNPRATVPTLIIDGKPMSESAAILILLADLYPDAKLIPKVGTPEREAWLQWVIYMTNTLMSTFRFWFYPRELEVDELDPTIRTAIQHKLEGIWDHLDKHLSAHGPYILGETFSGADLLLSMLMRWSRNMPRSAAHWPSLKRLADLIRQRDSWKKLNEIEGLSGW